jgi:hypothetical protein
VDRHVHKAGEPVDDGGETAREPVDADAASLAGTATRAVENRFAHVDDRRGDYLRKSGAAALIAAVAQAVDGHHVRLDAYDGLVAIDSPVGWFKVAQAVFGLVGAPFMVWSVVRQVLAWRRSSGERRQQLKNRVHLDVRMAGREVRGEARRRLVSEHVERLVQAGASLAWRTDNVRGSSVTLYDPEGNEFCVT